MTRYAAFWGAILLSLDAVAGPVLHLTFDHGFEDRSGGSHDAVPIGGAQIDHEHWQVGGGAANFTGASNCFVHVSAYTPAVHNEARSAAFWARATAPCTNAVNVQFLGWGDATLLRGVRFDVGLEKSDPTRLRLEFNAGYYVVFQGTSVNFGDGAWHHIMISTDGQQASAFADGKPYGPPIELPQQLDTGANVAGTVVGGGVREALSPRWGGRMGIGTQSRCFQGQIDDVGIWRSAFGELEAALLNGLGRVGDNDLRWLEAALELARQPAGATARINGRTWRRTARLAGGPGDWLRIEASDGAGSFVVLDRNGGGIQIIHRWWEFGWVQVSGVLLACFGLVGLLLWSADRVRLHMRLRRLEARERTEAERQRIARDLHDDLGSGLTELMQLGDLAQEEALSADQLRSRLSSMAGKTRELVTAVDEIVWTANPINDVLPRLADYLADYAQRFLSTHSIACRLDIMEGLPSAVINAKARHHLLLAVKESLNNAAKHSQASEVWLRIHCSQKELRIAIEDNGRGFDLASVQRGNGLGNLRSRLAELGGCAEILSRPGEGVKIQFIVGLAAIA